MLSRSFVPLFVLGVAAMTASAANPPSGTVSEANLQVAWTGEFLTPTGSADCGGPGNAACDNFSLNIVPPSFSFTVEIQLQPVGDWDLQVYGPGGGLAGDSGNAAGILETVILNNPAAGTYTVTASPFSPAPTSPSYTAQARILAVPPPANENITYKNYPAPNPLGRDAGEPSVGINWNTNRAMYIAGLETLRITYDDCSSPAMDDWEDVSYIWTSTTSADPILFTDNVTGRTFVSQLAGATSLMAFTDDDGENWTPSQGAGFASGVDHQTVGGGPFAPPLTRDPNGPIYPNAVYYCSQAIADAACARSDDGGISFGPAVPIYTAADCGGLHGSVKVAPNDGTVYVPNKNCNEQAVVVSENNGTTWSVRRVPGTNASRTDPSVGIASDGTVYVGLADGDGHPRAAVSHDKGLTWENLQDVGDPFGIQNTAFPAVVAGDPDRAAFAFLGTPTGGDGTGADASFAGVWHLYVAHTYDGGVTWTTVDVTPDDPVQRGSICGLGTLDCSCCRNLLDFNDADVDAFGRVVVGYADGCLGGCVNNLPNSNTDLATVARQTNGRRLFAAYDNVDAPAAPLAQAVLDSTNNALVHITWATPDDHGSPITEYRIYRRLTAGAYSLLIELPANVHAYDDTINPNESYFYQVTAVNALGEGPACRELSPTGQEPPANCCDLPGVEVVTDAPGDVVTGGSTQHDILSISVAGLLSDPGMPPSDLVFTMKVDNLDSLPVNSSWKSVFTVPGGSIHFVSMDTDALGAVTFNYGTFTPGTPGTFDTVGEADAGQFSSDGTIRITIAASNVGNPAVGQNLTDINGRTELLVGVLLIATDTTDNGGPFMLCACLPCSPDAQDDIAATPVNSSVVIHVLDNDSTPCGLEPLSVLSVTDPASGSTANNGDGTVSYSPNMNFQGIDSFSYTMSNTDGRTATATVFVVVGPCGFEPTFAGLASVDAPPEETCTLELHWSAPALFCPGTSVRYNVYRSTDSGFTPELANAIALGVTGQTYIDRGNLKYGVFYYYIVRAEDSTTFNDGPANGGNEDDNLMRVSGTPQGTLDIGPDFVDDMEPAAAPGYSTFSTRDVGGWTVQADPTAHSPNNAWVVLDDQPGSPTLTQKDDTLTLPAASLSDSSSLTFWHNFDFARFPLSAPDTAFQSGGVLEISADGKLWIDLGPYISSGGYNGVVDPTALSPLAGRAAWVGSSDGGANSPAPGRTDAMQQVVVDLGAAVSDPGTFNTTALLGARIRFRLGGTFQILIGGVQGTGWAVDDITLSGVLAPAPCAGIPPATVSGGALRKFHTGVGDDDITVNVGGRVENADVTSESRVGGITQLRLSFDIEPGGPGAEPVSIQQQVCPGGAQSDYGPYTGGSSVSAVIESTTLVLNFTPALENARTYKLTLGPEVTSVAGQSVEIRGLDADITSDGRVDAGDRSAVVGIWTGPGYSAASDITRDGATNAADRSRVVGIWTSPSGRCAP